MLVYTNKMNRTQPVASSFLSVLLLAACAPPAPSQEKPTDRAAARQQALRNTGVAAPLSLYPIRVLGRADANVADALGLVLERAGASDLAVAAPPFDPGQADWDAVPALLKAHVAAQAGAAPRWALYAQFLGDPRTGPTEVRFLVVDAHGELVLNDRQTPVDPAFRATAGRDPDPLGCSALVADRLFELAGWKKVPGGVRDGAFQRRWQQKSGAPDARERAAIDKRLAALRTNLRGASFAVLPVLWNGEAHADGAARVATAAPAELGCKAAAAASGALAVPASSNEQKRLWDLVAAVRTSLGKTAVDADYALAVDTAISDGGGAGFVHVVVLTKAGEVVIADWQNDQHPLYQQRAPKNRQDCEALAVARLQQLLR